jgi:hypothetical protein
MRKLLQLSTIFILSLVSAIHPENIAGVQAQAGFNTSYITGLAQYIVPRGEAFSIENFSYQGGSAYAVVSSSGPSALFLSNAATGRAEPITTQQEIESALTSYYLSKGYDPAAISKLESVHQGFEGIKDKRKAGEAECFRLMGQENRPCGTDFELCKAYCIGTPFCNNFAYGGELGEFINVIIQFGNNTRFLDEAYLNESTAFAALNRSMSKENADAYLASIGGINRAATKVSSSSVFYGYSFCFTPDYSLPAITTLQLSAQNAFRQGSVFLSLAETAAGIHNMTLDGMARKAAYDDSLQAALAAVEKKNGTGNLSGNVTIYLNSSANETAPLPQPEPQKFISSEVLIAAGGAAVVLIAIAFYLVKMRGAGGKKSEAFQKAEEDIRKGRR